MYNEIILAAFLHDIGKFMQKSPASVDNAGRHPELSKRFLDALKSNLEQQVNFDIVSELVLKHHESQFFDDKINVKSLDSDIKPFGILISQADNYSSYEREESNLGTKNFRTRPMDTVYSRINLDATKKVEALKLQYDMLPDGPHNAFPKSIKSINPNNAKKQYDSFMNEIGNFFKSNKDIGFKKMFNGIYGIVQKYTWCVPSNSQENIADISLFDHLKTTCAIASCLFQYHTYHDDFRQKAIRDKESNKFRLIEGDISGIQKYIFGDMKTGSGKIAKRLRARSFKIQMISMVVVQMYLDSLNLPYTNNLISSGGKFYILAPNLPSIDKKINSIRNNINNYLLENYVGELNINIESIPLKAMDFNNFGKVLLKINNKLSIEKKRPFKSLLARDNEWNSQFILSMNGKSENGICRGCGKHFIDKENEFQYCRLCLEDFKIGTKIPSMKSIGIQKDNNGILNFAGYSVDNNFIKSKSVYSVNNSQKGFPNIYIANHIPQNNNEVLSFSDIAKEAEGDAKIAYFKADVDNLGAIFAYGLKSRNNEQKDADSISRISTMSRLFDLFFSGWINEIIKKEYPNCYTVFAGGDDLFLIGPWSDVILLACKINTKFKEFFGNHKEITLSAGISIEHPKVPVQIGAKHAEDNLEKAKELCAPNHNTSKNQICILNRLIKWEDFAKTINEYDELSYYIEEGILTKADIWKLKKYSKMYEDYQKTQDVRHLRFLSHLAYDISRLKQNNNDDLTDAAIKWLQKLFLLGVNREKDLLLEHLGLIVDLTFVKNRKRSVEND